MGTYVYVLLGGGAGGGTNNCTMEKVMCVAWITAHWGKWRAKDQLVVAELTFLIWNGLCVCCIRKVLCDVHNKELEAADPFNLSITDMDELVCVAFLSPIVHYYHISFT